MGMGQKILLLIISPDILHIISEVFGNLRFQNPYDLLRIVGLTGGIASDHGSAYEFDPQVTEGTDSYLNFALLILSYGIEQDLLSPGIGDLGWNGNALRL